MVFDLAINNGLARPLLLQQGRTAWKWLRKFMCRYPGLTLLKPQVTSAARVKGLTKIKVAKFFEIYEPMLRLINISSHCLLNYEEIDLNVVQHKVCKVISLKGKRKISLSSAERGSLVTNVTCMNATVTYIPPLLVFLGAKWRLNFWTALDLGSIAACHRPDGARKTALSKSSNFFRVVKHLEKDPIILTLDGHYSYSRNIDVIECSRENGVHIFCLPPRNTHKLQSLWVSFMQPLKTYHAQEIEIWLKTI